MTALLFLGKGESEMAPEDKGLQQHSTIRPNIHTVAGRTHTSMHARTDPRTHTRTHAITQTLTLARHAHTQMHTHKPAHTEHTTIGLPSINEWHAKNCTT